MNLSCNRPAARLASSLSSTLCGLALLAALPALAAPASPFVTAGGGVWTADGTPVIAEVFNTGTTGPVLTQTGSPPSAYGQFRSEFGSNGFDISVTAGLDREVDGGSIWSDGFVVNGGTGQGTLMMSVHITGTVAGDAEMGYALFTSGQAFDLPSMMATIQANHAGFWALQFPNATRLALTGVASRCGQLVGASKDCGHVPFNDYQGPLDLTLSIDLPFTYGQTFYVASGMSGGVGAFGGVSSFFHSATLGITVPPSASLATSSGAAYAAAVPEPATAALWLAALALGMGGAVRRRAKA